MKKVITTTAFAVLAGAFALGGTASAQNYHGRDHGGWHQDRDRGHDDRRGGWDHDDHRGGWDRDDHRDRDWDRRDNGYHGRDRYDDHRRYDNGYRYDNRYNGWRSRSDWRRGGYVSRYDYDRGYRVDYRSHRRLYSPPYGYEWRRVDNNYVLVAIASGLIASIILDNY